MAEVSGTTFWRFPFQSLCQPKQLQEFIVMDTQIIYDKDKRHIAGASSISQKVSTRFILNEYGLGFLHLERLRFRRPSRKRCVLLTSIQLFTCSHANNMIK